MVFNSYQFIFGFLPLTYLGFVIAHRLGGWPAAFKLLAAASLAFYGQWGLALLAILLVSVAANYSIGNVILRLTENRRLATLVLIGGISANIASLAYFKYANFLIDIVNAGAGSGFSHIHLILPIGISFYTFIQIGYLIDAYNGQVERPGFGRYLLFATFLPCVTAGPLVLQREMFAQMKERQDSAFDTRRLAAGLTMFCMGLFKKVVLADSIAPYANSVFDAVAMGQMVDPVTAWVGTLCYSLQLYFDFSGYSDMAIGIGCIFGLKLPLNFNSPFKATDISDFWRRWHITMTRFFTNYVFMPLAIKGVRDASVVPGSRIGAFMKTAGIPVIVTFFIAGVWHGSGATFAVYGLIHGVAIAINLAWRKFEMPRLPAVVGWVLTMSVVASGLVVFRAPDLTTAGIILGNMWTGGIMFAPAADTLVNIDMKTAASFIVVLGCIVLLLPNTQQILHRDWLSSDAKPNTTELEAGILSWKPAAMASVVMAAAFAIAITSIGAHSTFLYYQF
jgi:D-alanyl-lipoteichoic acid acyltransferase DltB (MBOAT superfamily)